MQKDKYFYTYDPLGYIQTQSTFTENACPTVGINTLYFISDIKVEMNSYMVNVDPAVYDPLEHYVVPLKPIAVILSNQEIRTEFKKERRKVLEKSTVLYSNMLFDSDELSQNRMMRSVVTMPDDTTTQLWVLHDNSIVHITKPQFIEILRLAIAQQTNTWVQK